MALRIGGGKPPAPPVEEQAAPAPEPMPEDLMAELPETLDEEPVPEEPMAEGGGVVDPLVAGYKGPENGPFVCANCVFYGGQGEGTCAIVSGPIDPAGICNMFTSKSASEGVAPEEELAPTQEPMPEGEPYPEEEESSQEGY